MEKRVDNIDFKTWDTGSAEHKKQLEELNNELLRSVLIPKDLLKPTELPHTIGNYIGDYTIYGVPVITDPTKLYILKIDIPEEKKPWYKRLWKYIKRISTL